MQISVGTIIDAFDTHVGVYPAYVDTHKIYDSTLLCFQVNCDFTSPFKNIPIARSIKTRPVSKETNAFAIRICEPFDCSYHTDQMTLTVKVFNTTAVTIEDDLVSTFQNIHVAGDVLTNSKSKDLTVVGCDNQMLVRKLISGASKGKAPSAINTDSTIFNNFSIN